MWVDTKLSNLNICNKGVYQDISFLFFTVNYHNMFINKLLKCGKKSKLNNHIINAIAQVNKIINRFKAQFRRRYIKFIYGLYYNFLLQNCKVFVTKDYKVVKKERNYFYIFLRKNQRIPEIFKWNKDLLLLQYNYETSLQLSYILFDLYYFYEASDINAIKLSLLASFKRERKKKVKKSSKNWVLGSVVKFYS